MVVLAVLAAFLAGCQGGSQVRPDQVLTAVRVATHAYIQKAGTKDQQAARAAELIELASQAQVKADDLAHKGYTIDDDSLEAIVLKVQEAVNLTPQEEAALEILVKVVIKTYATQYEGVLLPADQLAEITAILNAVIEVAEVYTTKPAG